MSKSAKLIDDYNTKLMSNGSVRYLVASVCQDAQNETIDLVKSHASVLQQFNHLQQDGQTARRLIIGWLNNVYFTHLDVELLDQWWWEMHTRIQKMIVISMILEGNNLRSFNVEPQWDDIPQCLVHLYVIIQHKRKTVFPMLQKEYKLMCEQLLSDAGRGNWYMSLYLTK